MPKPALQITRARAPRRNEALSAAELAANQEALDTTIKAMGGREAIFDTLAVASDDPQVDHLLRLLADPVYQTMPLKQLCHHAGVTVVDLFAAYRKAMVVQAHLLAYKTITLKLPAIVEDVMRRAAPFEIPCTGCNGRKQIVEGEGDKAALVDCPTCNGHGVLQQLPDLDRQKLALELGQLVQKSAGINLTQNSLVVPPPAPEDDAPMAGPGTLIEMQHALRELQRGPRRAIPEAPVIDAETVAPDPPEALG